ncbi:hypothetical protein CA85_44760 [Allorhodopirellula solitaria]|uniref:Uncharacterized protein n=1 Tax=Allorhodopirellula solitaria TaxID=2527987 RepID=A0A5C5WYV1_9BACT|nr:hypothetical protein CA85_44760 [Allorhodopirellula solitaria]
MSSQSRSGDGMSAAAARAGWLAAGRDDGGRDDAGRAAADRWAEAAAGAPPEAPDDWRGAAGLPLAAPGVLIRICCWHFGHFSIETCPVGVNRKTVPHWEHLTCIGADMRMDSRGCWVGDKPEQEGASKSPNERPHSRSVTAPFQSTKRLVARGIVPARHGRYKQNESWPEVYSGNTVPRRCRDSNPISGSPPRTGQAPALAAIDMSYSGRVPLSSKPVCHRWSDVRFAPSHRRFAREIGTSQDNGEPESEAIPGTPPQRRSHRSRRLL